MIGPGDAVGKTGRSTMCHSQPTPAICSNGRLWWLCVAGEGHRYRAGGQIIGQNARFHDVNLWTPMRTLMEDAASKRAGLRWDDNYVDGADDGPTLELEDGLKAGCFMGHHSMLSSQP